MINLSEILNDKVGQTFYSPLFGNCVLSSVDADMMLIKSSDSITILDKYGKKSEDGEVLLFPSKSQRSWKKYIEDNTKPKVRNWQDVVKNYNIGANTVRCSFDYTAKSEMAYSKICIIVRLGYGGFVTSEEMRKNRAKWYVIYYNFLSKSFIVQSQYVLKSSLITFHTEEQAHEFLKDESNVELLYDYFMI